MKKFKIKETIKLETKFFIVPQRESGIFDLPAPAFKIYVWLLSHSTNFEFNLKYLTNGVKMHHKTVEQHFNLLLELGAIKSVNNDIEFVSLLTSKYIIKNKRKSNRKSVKNDIFSIQKENQTKSVKSDTSSQESKSTDKSVNFDINSNLKSLVENDNL
jgi:hypothetical protein